MMHVLKSKFNHLARTSFYRQISFSIRRKNLLHPNFALNDAWEARHKKLETFGLGTDKEWVITVQKKLQSTGRIRWVIFAIVMMRNLVRLTWMLPHACPKTKIRCHKYTHLYFNQTQI